MRNRIITLMLVLILCVCLAMPSFAEDIAITETVTEEVVVQETSSESIETTVLETPETLSDEIPSGIENAEKNQLLEIVNGLSGEGVDKMQAILLAGINSVERGQSTTWDKIADFCERHIEAISLIACAFTVLLYMITRSKSNKKLRDNIGTATNNAVETVEIAKQMNADSVVALEKAAQRVDSFKNTLDNATEKMTELMAEIRAKETENESLRSALRHNAAADMLVADTVNELLQLANIPQNKKDAIYTKISHAKALIDSEGETNEAKDEETDQTAVV